jgi:hypothetical protein
MIYARSGGNPCNTSDTGSVSGTASCATPVRRGFDICCEKGPTQTPGPSSRPLHGTPNHLLALLP